MVTVLGYNENVMEFLHGIPRGSNSYLLRRQFGTLFRSSVKILRNYDRKSRCDALPVLARHSARSTLKYKTCFHSAHHIFISSRLNYCDPRHILFYSCP